MRDTRIKFIGRKITNKDKDFNYYIEQVVSAKNLDEALLKLEDKYVVEEVLE